MLRVITAILGTIALVACAPITAHTQVPPTRAVASDTLPVLPAADRVRLAEAFRLADAVGDRVWDGWSQAPFAILLVTADHEFLLRHPAPSSDFTRIGYDSLLATEVFVRSRVFPPNLLAAFPAVGNVPTIVIGQPANTNQTSTRWVLTLLHEHFHQLQSAQPDYYRGVAALNLARGDTTGMWMLNYPFPYDSAAVQARFVAWTRALGTALARAPTAKSGDSLVRDPMVQQVSETRRQLSATLSADDDRYLAFQMWQEGVARYTELQVARFAASSEYSPGEAFRALPDYSEYAVAAAAIEQNIRAGLSNVDLSRSKRVAFYAAGAATALLLDAAVPGWRTQYFAQKFSLDPLMRERN